MTQTVSNPDLAVLPAQSLEILVKQIQAVLTRKNQAVLALPAGRGVKGLFGLLADASKIDWSRVHIFLLDERLLPLTDPESNFKLLEETFARKLLANGRLPRKNLHPFVYHFAAADGGLSAYEKE